MTLEINSYVNHITYIINEYCDFLKERFQNSKAFQKTHQLRRRRSIGSHEPPGPAPRRSRGPIQEIATERF
jgi:hypothetical protein